MKRETPNKFEVKDGLLGERAALSDLCVSSFAPERRATNESFMAIVLAGGAGSRLAPFTKTMPKPFLPLGSLEKLIGPTMSAIAAAEAESVYIAGNLLQDGLDYLRCRWGDVQVMRESERKGQVAALLENITTIAANPARHVLITPADYFHTICLRHALLSHVESLADLTVLAKIGSAQEAAGHENLKVESLQIRGRLAAPESQIGNTYSIGIYIFRKEALLEALRVFQGQDEAHCEMGMDLLPLLFDDARRKCMVHVTNSEWLDLGTVARYFEGNLSLHGFNSNSRLPVWHNSPIHPTAFIDPSATIVECVINERVRVREGASLKRVIIMEDAEIGAGAKIEQAILGPGTVVPPRFDLSAVSSMRALCLRVEGGVACLTKDHPF